MATIMKNTFIDFNLPYSIVLYFIYVPYIYLSLFDFYGNIRSSSEQYFNELLIQKRSVCFKYIVPDCLEHKVIPINIGVRLKNK